MIFILLGFHRSAPSQDKDASIRPNIIYILADDLGYGDVFAYNKESKIPTPNIDRLATRGTKFTNAHSASAVCSPSRYSILTVNYPWRSSLKKGVLWSYDWPLIKKDQLTIGQFLKIATCLVHLNFHIHYY
jgi:arylsulfatase A-like enzyme